MGDLDWIDNVPAGIELEPRTLYYFEPPLNVDEVYSLANRIINSDDIKEFMLTNFTRRNISGVNYFVTDGHLDMIIGWCDVIKKEEAIEIYGNRQVVNGREKLKIPSS